MRLIGMLDSPYVRRVAISFDLLGIPFEHESVSVFSTFTQFKGINPVVKAPTLICDDGEVLMDSSLILQFVEAAHGKAGVLWSRDPRTLQHQTRAVGLALAACEKAAQYIYERNLRPAELQYDRWLERVQQQLHAACAGLEAQFQEHPELLEAVHSLAIITSAVAWQFIQSMLASLVPASDYPRLTALSARMEATREFRKYPPDGPGVPGLAK
ncbi:MAG TPA: glutathione S-transferase family protein [Pseudomonadales bacterium]